MSIRKYIFIILALFFYGYNGFSKQHNFADTVNCSYIGKEVLILEDKTNVLSFDKAKNSKAYKSFDKDFINLGISGSTFWIKYKVANQTNQPLCIQLTNPLIDEVLFFCPLENGKYSESLTGIDYSTKDGKTHFSNYIYNLDLQKGEVKEYYFKVTSHYNFLLPFQIGTKENIYKQNNNKDLIHTLFFGIILAIVIYNLFLYFSVQDKSYFFYILYTFSNASIVYILEGYCFDLSRLPIGFHLSFYILSFVNAVLAFVFLRSILNTPKSSRLFRRLRWILVPYSFSLIAALFEYYRLSAVIININSVCIGIAFPIILYVISRTGSRPAKIVFFAFNGYLAGVVVFGLKNFNILPINDFTTYSMMIGITVDAFLLSFALGDRINMLMQEKDLHQQEVIKHLRLNEEYLKLTRELAINSEKLKKEMLSAQFESLKNQVNPHFLFNSLNVLIELVYKDQEHAALFVKELAEIYRYVLRNKDKEVVPVELELDFIRSFVYLLGIRFGQNLKFKISYDKESEMMIPPLSLQLLIENCIKHNIITSDDPLYIRIYSEEDYLTVSNNLQLKDSRKESTSIGLANIQKRYEHFTKEQIVIINDEKNFIVKLPLLIKEKSNSIL